MPVTRDMLLSELQTLLRLTAVEQTIATVRRAQARTTSLEKELRENAAKAGERAQLLSDAIRRVGGVPDVVGSALGKAGGFATTQLNQVQTLQGALLGDLTLEHQLRERTRYARTLATSLGETGVLPVLDRLETAHSATIDWLETRLAEVGRTGTSLLKATPLQSAVGTVRRLTAAPLNAVAGTVNSATALLGRVSGKAGATLEDAADRAADAAGDAAERVKEAAQDAVSTAGSALAQGAATVESAAAQGVQAAEQAAGSVVETVTEGVQTAADAVSSGAQAAAETVSDGAQAAAETVSDGAQAAAGAVAEGTETVQETVAELAEDAKEAAAELTGVDLDGQGEVSHPFAGYEKLSGDRIMAHVRDTEDVEELRQLLAFETANKARKGVLAAVQERLAELSVNA